MSQLLLNPATQEIIRDNSPGPDEVVARPARPSLSDAERAELLALPVNTPLRTAYLNSQEAQVRALVAMAGNSTVSITIAAPDSLNKGAASFVVPATAAQVAINAAINSLGAPGGKIVLQAGTYDLTDELVINQPYVTLEGQGFGFWGAFVNGNPATGTEGAGSTKLRQLTSGKNIIRVDNVTNGGAEGRLRGVAVRDLYLYGANKTGTALICNDGHDTDQLIVERVMAHNTMNGFDIYADTPHVRGCTVMDVGGAGIISRGSVYGVFEDNVIADNVGDGIQLLGGSQPTVTNNTIVRCQKGIYSTSCIAPQINTNKFYNNRDRDIHVLGASPKLLGNASANCGSATAAIHLDGASNYQVVANDVASAVGSSIVINGTRGVVNSNVVKDSGGAAAIDVTGSGGNCTVNGNQVYHATNISIRIQGNDGVCNANILQPNSSNKDCIQVTGLAWNVHGNRIAPDANNTGGYGINAAGNSNISVALNYVIGGSSFSLGKYNLPADNTGIGTGTRDTIVNLANI